MAGGGNHEFRAQCASQLLDLNAAFGSEYKLRLAIAIAQINEQHPTMVAIAVNPTAERGLLADMFAGQFTAGVGSQQCRVLVSVYRGEVLMTSKKRAF